MIHIKDIQLKFDLYTILFNYLYLCNIFKLLLISISYQAQDVDYPKS